MILGFKGAGFETVPVANGAELARELAQLAHMPDIGLVLITESMAAEAPEALTAFRESCLAILTTIPTHKGSQHLGFVEMRRAIERSIGVDMLGKE